MRISLRRCALVAAATAALALLCAAPASARTTVKPVKVAATEQQDGSYAATATCPAGRKVINGGFVGPNTSSVIVNHAVGDDAWTIKAFDTGTISAVAYCSLYVKDIEVATATGTMDGLNDQQGGATASCPSGTSIVSGGWEYEQATANSSVYTTRPVGTDQWMVYGASNTTGNSITAYAYCVSGRTVKVRAGEKVSTKGTPPPPRPAAGGDGPGMRSGRGGFQPPAATVGCKTGETLFGGGYETTPLPDFYNQAGPDTFFSKSARTGRNGWKALAADFSGFQDGELQAFAVCRKPGT